MAKKNVVKTQTKRLMVEKTSQSILYITVVAAFVSVFCIVAAKTLINQAAYQNRIIDAKNVAKKQLDTNLSAVQKINNTYTAFINTPQNIIGGNPSGTAQNDGNNAKIILDALPPKYDFPGLIAEIQTISANTGNSLQSITGTDDQLNQQKATTTGSPQPVIMQINIGVQGDTNSYTTLLNKFQQSIRPFQITSLKLAGQSNAQGSNGSAGLTIAGQTYYQTGKTFTLGSEIIK